MIKDKLLPWRMAQARKSYVHTLTTPMRIATAFINTWVNVYYPEPKK